MKLFLCVFVNDFKSYFLKMNEIAIPNGLVNARIKVRKIKQPYSPQELFKLHTLCGFIGMRGSGKTYAMVNLANKYLDEGSFTRVFIISPTYESNPIFHILHADDDDVYSNPLAATRDINDILKKCKQDYEDYESYEFYMKAYNKWKKGKTLQLDEHTTLENNNYEEPPEIPRPSPLLIIDDMSHSDLYSTSRQNPFINLCLRHRHINHGTGITIFLAAQTFLSGIPKALRQNIQQYFIWPTKDTTQLDAIYHEVANLVQRDDFIKMYEQATRDPHSFLTIDNNPTHPSLQFRRNFNIYLTKKHN
jgi:PhoH-like protein